MRYEPGTFCPLLKKECIKHNCAWFMEVRGTDPNTGREIDEWACAQAWVPMLLIENTKEQRHTAAAVESFRNEMVRSNENSQRVLLATVNAQAMNTIGNK